MPISPTAPAKSKTYTPTITIRVAISIIWVAPIWIIKSCIIWVMESWIKRILVYIDGNLVWVTAPGGPAYSIAKVFLHQFFLIRTRAVALDVGKNGSFFRNTCKLLRFFSKKLFVVQSIFVRFLIIISSICLVSIRGIYPVIVVPGILV